jgi:hypoxanthine phosphoribosyltransferase
MTILDFAILKKFNGESLSLDYIRDGASTLCNMLERGRDFVPDIIIGVNQGGMAVAAAMNKHFQKPGGCPRITSTRIW